ncbi:zinc finger protein ZOP1-like isoform X1 [Phoenix dactylifera]|uniref:Zinc finger protein ZOP1 isoform X1 n=1 Tax=Phoenix dactylifera TaxID=42345 RepID=A0A8B7D2L5_PHODC|nr:zinc finger protein ZOP1 isoform X1 [Phoenix dactylifera]XP_038975570.1 zinc finger protein ZOP1-like isoform X1 [Phoenix dactylifera]
MASCNCYDSQPFITRDIKPVLSGPVWSKFKQNGNRFSCLLDLSFPLFPLLLLLFYFCDFGILKPSFQLGSDSPEQNTQEARDPGLRPLKSPSFSRQKKKSSILTKMTEYWVSQGNKWCDFCKIYISNNPLTIRTHELGQRHKDNVAKRLASMRKESAAKEKEQKEAARALEQIEAKAKRSYQKDLATFKEAAKSANHALESNDAACSAATRDGFLVAEWEYDATSGYYYNEANGFHHDPNSGLYYSSNLGKWVTQEEAFKSSQVSRPDMGHLYESKSDKLTSKTSQTKPVAEVGAASKYKGGPAPGPVISTSLNPMRTVKGAPSSLAINKRKRGDEKTKAMTKEEEAALKAREAARQRVEKREAPLLGLYRSY